MCSRGFLYHFGVVACLLNLGFAGTAAAGADVGFGGSMAGYWQLPPGPGETGVVQGDLFMDDSEDPVFTLDGMVTEWRGPLETRFGGMSGVLRDPSDPKGAPLLGVAGMWRGPRSGIQGTYQAYLYNLETGEVIGEMQGYYYDPAPGEGEFSGLWVIHGKP